MNSHAVLVMDATEMLQTQKVNVIRGRDDKGDFVPVDEYDKIIACEPGIVGVSRKSPVGACK